MQFKFLNKSLYEEKENAFNDDAIFTVQCISPINIALIKYWGKSDEKLNYCLNDSLSLTLSHDNMNTRTTLSFSSKFKSHKIKLNGINLNFDTNPKMLRFKMMIDFVTSLIDWKFLEESPRAIYVHVDSVNNFPTAAGLASSASGFCALAVCLYKIFKRSETSSINNSLPQVFTGEEIKQISELSRLGSGSSCRSLYGGFVKWINDYEGSFYNSYSRPVYTNLDNFFLNNLVILILVTNPCKKQVGSTIGMARTVLTSDLIKHRANDIVPQRLKKLEFLIKMLCNKFDDETFSEFCEIIMKESNQLQAICRDTLPPIIYSNQISDFIIEFITSYNQLYGLYSNTKFNIVAYTYDAGPNAFLFMMKNNVKSFIDNLKQFVKFSNYDLLNNGSFITNEDKNQAEWSKYFRNNTMLQSIQHLCIDNVIFTKAGPGPCFIR